MKFTGKDKKNIIEIGLEVWQQIDNTGREFVCIILQIYPYGSVMVEENCVIEYPLMMAGNPKFSDFNSDNLLAKSLSCLFQFHDNQIAAIEHWLKNSSRNEKYNEAIREYLFDELKIRPPQTD